MPHIASITELVAVLGLRKTQGRLSPRPFKISIPAALILSAPLLLAGPPSERRVPAASPTKLTFERAIVPIVQKHCWKCHGEGARRAGLDLRTLAGILKGGESGEPTIVPGKAQASHLFELVSTGQMPPKGRTRLNEAEIATIRKWIDAGAAGERPAPGDLHADLSARMELARQVQFILEVKCSQCHGRKEQKSGLDLRTRESMLKGGKSGPALVPGAPLKSAIVKRIAADEMPPRDLRYPLSIKPVTESELQLIRQWINVGAPAPPPPKVLADESVPTSDADRDWWSFRPPQRPPVPGVQARDRVRTPLDAFVIARLEASGLGLSPEADRRTLIRRAYTDLIGLPPSPAEIDTFLKDPDPAAYERLIDRLLASPRYGERWGQHWLDAAGYADSEGALGADPIYPNFYRYRDYVIRSLNNDKPYERFLLEQLAGDELVDSKRLSKLTPELADNLIATGFLRTGIDPTVSPETNFPSDRYQVLADTVEIVSSSLLGLTMRCARCHSHKYDPISQRDYYQFTAIFSAAYSPEEWVKPPERFLVLADAAEQEEARRHNAAVDAKIAPLQKEVKDLTQTFTARLFEQRLAKLVPEPQRQPVRKAIQTPAEKRNQVQKDLAAKFEAQLQVDAKELPGAFPEFKQKSEALQTKLAAVEKTRHELPKAHGLTDVDPEGLPFYLLKRGEWNLRGPQVLPNVPAVLRAGAAPYTVKKPATRTSGRRLALARWLTQPDHPLTSRVLVNRIWQHHFGTGIVATADDFGHTGTRPSHPALLDWLACELVDQGWSLKKLHRLIMTSSVYRQQSQSRGAAVNIDPENRLLWRMPLRRIDAEVLRDSILAVAGQLNAAMFGPAVAVEEAADGQVHTRTAPEFQRRSIYILHRRSTPLTILETFDAPRMTTNCLKRRRSTVVSQALLMLNSEFVHGRAAELARRIAHETGTDVTAQLDQVYQRILGRPPGPREQDLGRDFLQKQTKGYAALVVASFAARSPAFADPQHLALTDVCLALLNSAEFSYVD
jgi:Protein of unknown function (DUF1553)/Protein of unknown function (DUF1549)/Planctomycete cytochrome C